MRLTFGERLKQLREESGRTMEEVAGAVGLTKPTIYRYESGIITNVPPARVHNLANYFGVTRPYLMGWTDERNANPDANLDMVAERLRSQTDADGRAYWRDGRLYESDCITAATQAARAIVKFGISRAPVYPHQVLQKSEIATMVSFADAEELREISGARGLRPFRRANDLVMSSVHQAGGKPHYIFSVNRDAPMGKIRLALAVELGHIYLGHSPGQANVEKAVHEAECFAVHFEFPRALIRLLEERGYVFTKKSFSRIFGDCEWCLDAMLRAGPLVVSAELNRMVKEQFTAHVNLLDEAGILDLPADGEVLDLCGYMGGYQD